jgi:hypothetical protein
MDVVVHHKHLQSVETIVVHADTAGSLTGPASPL